MLARAVSGCLIARLRLGCRSPFSVCAAWRRGAGSRRRGVRGAGAGTPSRRLSGVRGWGAPTGAAGADTAGSGVVGAAGSSLSLAQTPGGQHGRRAGGLGGGLMPFVSLSGSPPHPHPHPRPWGRRGQWTGLWWAWALAPAPLPLCPRAVLLPASEACGWNMLFSSPGLEHIPVPEPDFDRKMDSFANVRGRRSSM